MNKSIIEVIKGIESEKLKDRELSILMQNIAQYLEIRTTSNFAKYKGKSFNGIKNHYPYIIMGGVKFHFDAAETNNLPF